MLWGNEVNLSVASLIAFSNGGALALFHPQMSQRTHVPIYSSFGKLLSNITFDNGYLINMGWSAKETLVMINSDGFIVEYSLSSLKIADYRIDVKLNSAKIIIGNSETFIAAITHENVLLVRRALSNPFEDMVELDKLISNISCWVCYYSSQKNECSTIICSQNKTIVFVEGINACSMTLEATFHWNMIIKIALSTDNRKVALLSDTNNIWCGSSDFKG
ncbi:hypothetical protein HZS_4499 [Henneguya salminicola]|nr:hypothetical protein HZS_4499 [Henneguya salminicola]